MFSPTTLILILLVVNVPLYAFLAWIMFDDLRKNSHSIVGGFIKTLAVLISGRLFFRLMADHDDDNSMLNIIVVLIASALAIYGEYIAIRQWWPYLIAA